MPWVYILTCRDGTFYVGSTATDPVARTWEHNHDEYRSARYTIKRRPVVLVYAEEVERIDEAYRRERQLHGWSHSKKQALIDGRLDDLRELSRPRGGDPSTSSRTGESADGDGP
jgi:putative endonuclease